MSWSFVHNDRFILIIILDVLSLVAYELFLISQISDESHVLPILLNKNNSRLSIYSNRSGIEIKLQTFFCYLHNFHSLNFKQFKKLNSD